MSRALPIIAAALALTLGLAARADAFVYWANATESNPGTSIGRANTDGTSPNQGFIGGLQAPAGCPAWLAINGSHLYWAGNDVGRANLDGTGTQQSFIDPTTDPLCGVHEGGVAIDSEHIYWADSVNNRIGRANLDGSGVNPSFVTVTSPSFICGLAVAGGHLYWGLATTSPDDAIARVDLSTPGSPDEDFVELGLNTRPCVGAVDATDIYYTLPGIENAIGKVSLATPEAPDNSLITGSENHVVNPLGIAIDATQIYWANQANTLVGRADLDGGNPQALVQEGSGAAGVAVNSLSSLSSITCGDVTRTAGGGQAVPIQVECTSEDGTITYSTGSSPAHGRTSGLNAATGAFTYTADARFPGDSFTIKGSNGAASATARVTVISNDIQIGKARRNKRSGTAKLRVRVPGAGKLRLAGTKVLRGATAQAGRARVVLLPIRAKGKALKRLSNKGRAKVRAAVTFSPAGGNPATEAKSVLLIKK